MRGIRSYIGSTVEEAMSAARREVDDDALLVSVTRVPGGSGGRGKFHVEVQAPLSRHNSNSALESGTASLRRELAELERILDPGRTIETSNRFAQATRRFNPWDSSQIVAEIARARALAFVGPAGSGKTTACAKLLFSLGLPRRASKVCSIVATRVGGNRLMRAYADLLDVPFQEIDPGDLPHVLRCSGDTGLVFIDFPSYPCSDQKSGAEAAEAVRSLEAAFVFLVADACSSEESLEAAYERNRSFSPRGLFVSKSDEFPNLDAVAAFARRYELPIAYVGTGQLVPEDLRTAHDYLVACPDAVFFMPLSAA